MDGIGRFSVRLPLDKYHSSSAAEAPDASRLLVLLSGELSPTAGSNEGAITGVRTMEIAREETGVIMTMNIPQCSAGELSFTT